MYGPSNETAAGVRTESKSHSVTLSHLTPGTSYAYRVLCDDTPLTSIVSFFQTDKDQKTPYTFVVFGDSGTGNQAQYDVAGLIEDIAPDLLIHTGDVVYDKGETHDYNPKYFTPYRNTINRIPLYPCLGNHDLYTEDGKAYLEAFILPEDESGSGTERYYSFDYANAHFISLDIFTSSYLPGSDQYNWLDKDLSTHDKTWKFVFFHVPAYCSWSRHPGSEAIRKYLSPLFEKYGVDIVFSGHVHAYERTYPIKAGKVSEDGVVYVITGGGGARLEEPVNYKDTRWSSHVESAYHVTRVKIDGDSLLLEALKPGGVVFDSYRARPEPSN